MHFICSLLNAVLCDVAFHNASCLSLHDFPNISSVTNKFYALKCYCLDFVKFQYL